MTDQYDDDGVEDLDVVDDQTPQEDDAYEDDCNE